MAALKLAYDVDRRKNQTITNSSITAKTKAAGKNHAGIYTFVPTLQSSITHRLRKNPPKILRRVRTVPPLVEHEPSEQSRSATGSSS